MSEKHHTDLAAQFRELGENLKNFFQTAWDSEEAQQFKEELREGLTELGTATRESVEDFKASEAGQKIKTEAEDLKARFESGELETKTRQEISKTLNLINQELQKAIDSFSKPKADPED